MEAIPLVSIDLIIRNEQNQVLLGKRTNRPVQQDSAVRWWSEEEILASAEVHGNTKAYCGERGKR